jgi:hypothetical protein
MQFFGRKFVIGQSSSYICRNQYITIYLDTPSSLTRVLMEISNKNFGETSVHFAPIYSCFALV